ncbi:hypothetical protein Bbelb_230980 [Branchiostoma belcheri]|nr:hypothetical protein Bbelb_230980 [Branchiostoma belcheri]
MDFKLVPTQKETHHKFLADPVNLHEMSDAIADHFPEIESVMTSGVHDIEVAGRRNLPPSRLPPSSSSCWRMCRLHHRLHPLLLCHRHPLLLRRLASSLVLLLIILILLILCRLLISLHILLTSTTQPLTSHLYPVILLSSHTTFLRPYLHLQSITHLPPYITHLPLILRSLLFLLLLSFILLLSLSLNLPLNLFLLFSQPASSKQQQTRTPRPPSPPPSRPPNKPPSRPPPSRPPNKPPSRPPPNKPPSRPPPNKPPSRPPPNKPPSRPPPNKPPSRPPPNKPPSRPPPNKPPSRPPNKPPSRPPPNKPPSRPPPNKPPSRPPPNKPPSRPPPNKPPSRPPPNKPPSRPPPNKPPSRPPPNKPPPSRPPSNSLQDPDEELDQDAVQKDSMKTLGLPGTPKIASGPAEDNKETIRTSGHHNHPSTETGRHRLSATFIHCSRSHVCYLRDVTKAADWSFLDKGWSCTVDNLEPVAHYSTPRNKLGGLKKSSANSGSFRGHQSQQDVICQRKEHPGDTDAATVIIAVEDMAQRALDSVRPAPTKIAGSLQ